MATRSNISVKVGDVYHTIYVHWDGYPEGVGKTLLLNYNSQELAEKLVSNGDISSLGDSSDKPEGHTFNNPVKGYTVYYGRDRGDTGTDMQLHDVVRFEQEYAYGWDGSKWLVSGYSLEDADLAEVLGFEPIETNEPDISDDDKVLKYFGCSIDEVQAINEEWSVTYNTNDPRMTDSYNDRQRWGIRHREAPYQGMDEDGIWHHTFFGRTLYEAVSKANEYLARGKEFEAE
jgi:hypothetical protein